ncbi:glycosyltransferase [Aquabacterium sp. A7-Y]|uniref:glycosyltransferase family protein n=1 Tax=Aquabacterium sp. A7-Y TaxID=1349605 RepID=UPI00223DEEA0|nr:glycosyltransferase [Aquabacterium sp. A7-Y]MCW7541381.1 glycosyltransferase [Aquabacterium sp. A7-Y]
MPDHSALPAWSGAHASELILVVGCGTSAALVTAFPSLTTIGVNDVGRLFDPTYLVVVNPRNQFKADRFRYVERSKALALFTQLDLGPVDPSVVRFRLGRYGGTEFDVDGVLHYTQNSPYVAVCLAAHMGARRIGLIGVDFTDHHFFAATGRHALASRLAQIDQEYGALAEALRRQGVELVNLSPASRLQSLPRLSQEAFTGGACAVAAPVRRQRVFVVNYRFLSCGEVFADGLRHAAAELGVDHADAYWDEPRLPEKVAAFHPDLLMVVHGRRFAQKWRDHFRAYRTAVWLTDEPYEVDDTERWSSGFDAVFANDPTTLHRHRNAHYLPVCFDPKVHHSSDEPRPYKVGFIGGYNATRERFLLTLAEAGLLGYVVGGPWRAPALRQLCLATNIPPGRTADLYRQTENVVNVFRETHHFNTQHVPAHAMNPRIYEALACGAAVVSERRAEIGEVFPELPQFDSPEELVSIVQHLLADREALATLRRQCAAHLDGHRYRDRLARVLAITTQHKPTEEPSMQPVAIAPSPPAAPTLPLVAGRAPPAARPEPLPFTAPPRRNLLYHIWPVRGSTWRWNLDELKRRIDLFNGRRIIGIVCDARSEPAEAVQADLDGHGCEFVVAPNDERGEAITFTSMLERVASTEHNELSFYAHAKGVKYEPQFPPSVRRWAEVQYGVLLDHWPAVKEQLQRHAMTGIFRKHGRFGNHHNLGDWHYSGTFFWMRHAHVFRRRWQDVPQFYGGVEAWPGTLFHRDETGCLLLDQLRELPYQDRFWSQRGEPAFRQWQAGVRPVPVPQDLAMPRPFDGHTAPRLEQKPEEFAWWIDRLLHDNVRSLLMVGGGWGGEEWHILRRFHEAGREIAITTLAATERREWHEAARDAEARYGQAPSLVVGNTGDPGIETRLNAHCDAVFIDGDHGYRGCRQDFEFARRLQPRLIGLHDIVDSDWHAHARCCVSRLWAELQGSEATEQRVSADWGGIGIVACAR